MNIKIIKKYAIVNRDFLQQKLNDIHIIYGEDLDLMPLNLEILYEIGTLRRFRDCFNALTSDREIYQDEKFCNIYCRYLLGEAKEMKVEIVSMEEFRKIKISNILKDL